LVKITIEKQCGCFRKSSHKDEQSFNTKQLAEVEAQKMCEDMNKNFCFKHKFYYEVIENNIIIKMEVNR